MGLTSLVERFTGPRVKEITPQPQCSWLEKNRPQTSASTRTVKKIPHLQLKPDATTESRPTTSHEGRKKKRSLSISRPKLLEESRKDRKTSGARGSDTVPDVPALPPSLSPRLAEPAEEILRPGTALTTTGSMSTTERFELSADALHSPTFHSPLPSPLSPAFPASPESHLTAASQEDTPIESGGGLRKRSNSTASGKPKQKRASWFVSGKKKAGEVELPPPLPPPAGPPPLPPGAQPIVAELPDSRPPMERNPYSWESVPETPLSPATKNSLDSDSILNAFPSVPVPTGSSSTTPDANVRNSANKDEGLASTSTARDSGSKPQSPPPPSTTPRPRPIAIPTQTIDGLLAPEITKEAPKHDSKQLPPLPSEPSTAKKKDDHKSLSFSEELQQEYDRLMELMGEQPSPGAVMSVVGEFDFKSQSFQDPQKFSNDEALSKLEFGILK